MICLKYSYIFMIFIFMFSFSLMLLSMDYSLNLEFSLISWNSNLIVMVILIDWLSMMFSSFVLLISSSVLMYSKEYMSMEKNLDRFILLVVNLISILLGWDGLGLVSYCLVIYYQNEKSFNAGSLTVFTNRIGDYNQLLE